MQMTWEIGLSTNIFEINKLLMLVCQQNKNEYREIRKYLKVKMKKTLKDLDIDKSITWRYFNGGSHGDSRTFGARGIIFLRENHEIKFKAIVRKFYNNNQL